MKQGKLRILLIVVLSVILLTCSATGLSCNKSQTFTVSFDTDGGTKISSITVNANEKVGNLPVAQKDGYKFDGWSDAKGGEVNVDSDYIVTQDITFYAVYKKSGYCTVRFVTDGTKVSDIKVKSGEQLGSLPFTDKYGYSFTGWYRDDKFTDVAYSDDIVDNDLTLYALFEVNSVESALPEYTELSLDTDKKNFEISIKSSETVDERNLDKFVSVSAMYGILPKISVTSIGDDKYTLCPIGGYQNGGVYKIAITDGSVQFVDLEVQHEDDYTEDKVIKTVYVSIKAENEEVVCLKNGVLEMKHSAAVFSTEDNFFTLSEDDFQKLSVEKNAILHVTDSDPENDFFVKITDFKNVENEFQIYFEDCDTDDVYEEFEINVDDVTAVNEKTLDENKTETDESMQRLVAELYDSEGTRAITSMLANALKSSPTVNELANGSGYKDRISDETGISITVDGLLEGLKITARLGSALNPNFNGISIPAYNNDRWTMLSITFNYEGDIKENLKIEADITIKQYIYVWFSANSSSSTGDFKVEVTPYSQTDIEFKILVCSASKDDGDKKDDKGDKKEEKKDISVEIEELTKGNGDTSTIIAEVQEMLENKGDDIELCKVPMFSASYLLGGVVSINFDLNFVIKVSFAAGVKIEATLLEATTIGVTGNYKNKTIDTYRRSAKGSDRYIFDFYAYGYLGVKAGVQGELTVSFVGLKKALRAGVGIEVGAYADLYGYLHYHAEERRVFKDIDTNGRHFQSLEGGMYFESGIYLELKAFVGVGKKEYGVSKEFKFKLLDAGSKYLYVGSSDEDKNEEVKIVFNENEQNEISYQDIIPVEGKYMDITTGKIENRVIPGSNLKLISDTNLFRVDNERKVIVANLDKINVRIPYGIPSGKITLYYKGANILFSSAYLEENVPELKGFKELCKVTVYYLPEGVSVDEDSDIGKEVTLNYVVSYTVDGRQTEETVKTETVIAGQYVKGGIPDEVITYCHKNFLLTEEDGDRIVYDGLDKGKQLVTSSATYRFNTAKAQRFVGVQYLSDYGNKIYTLEIYALEYDQLPQLTETHRAAPTNVYTEFFAVMPDGNSHVMGNEYLSKYDLYMRGTYGFETGKVLASAMGSKEQIDKVFADMKQNSGDFARYSEYYTYTLKAEYVTGVQRVSFEDQFGRFGIENVKYGESFKVPDYWIANINQSTDKKLAGWDIDNDGIAEFLPNQEFVVTEDMTLTPVFKSVGYTLTVVQNGNVTEYDLDANSRIPQDILNVINKAPTMQTAENEGSFYSESYWRILTTDFVEGDDRSAYFKGISWKYQMDITTMPACDVTITLVNGDLYHYVTLTDETGGHFEVKNDDGSVSEFTSVKVAVRDGYYVGNSKDYGKIKYVIPKEDQESGISHNSLVGTDNEYLDIYGTVITSPKQYFMRRYVVKTDSYDILFEYSIFDEYGNEIYYEKMHNVKNVKKEEYDKLCSEYEKEYNYMCSEEFYRTLNTVQYTYSMYFDGNLDLNYEAEPDFYGVISKNYRVVVQKAPKLYTVTIIINDDNYSEQESKNYFKYGEVFTCPESTFYKVVDEDGQKVWYYFAGYDVDGDGKADYLPSEKIRITEDIKLSSLWVREQSTQ